MKKGTFKSLLFAVFCGFCAFGATAATSLFSNYGQIQNVQNYSTNPFWTPNSPYNQRLPQPVYVQGADLTAEDCFKVVQSLVSAQCLARNNCKDTTLADIRPTIMVQLSNLPGNNYVSACSGYIDGVFESYVAQFGTNTPNRAVAFPNATEPNQKLNDNNKIQIQNPYKQEIPQWQQEIKERSQELQELQQQNGAGSEQLSAADFPMTYDDLSFSERMALKTADYAQYKDMKAYVVPDFKNTKEWCEGKGSGTAECKGYEQQQTQNGQPGKQQGNQPSNQQADQPSGEKIYSAKACYYPKGIISGGCANERVSTGKNWLGKLCMSVCDVDPVTDDLNTKVLFPVMNKKYCIDKKNKEFQIVEHESRKPIVMTEQQYNQIKTKIASDLRDKDNCDYGYLKLDLLVGYVNSGNFALVESLNVDD